MLTVLLLLMGRMGSDCPAGQHSVGLYDWKALDASVEIVPDAGTLRAQRLYRGRMEWQRNCINEKLAAQFGGAEPRKAGGRKTAVFAVTLSALAVLAAAGSVYYAAFLRQIVRSYGRFHHNTLSEGAALPRLPVALSSAPNTSADCAR